jgi:hypothetical protein
MKTVVAAKINAVFYSFFISKAKDRWSMPMGLPATAAGLDGIFFLNIPSRPS